MSTIYEVFFGAFVEATELLEGLPASADPLVNHTAWGLIKEIRETDAGASDGKAWQGTVVIPASGSVQLDLSSFDGVEQTESGTGKGVLLCVFLADANNAAAVTITGAGTNGYVDFARGDTLWLPASGREYRHTRSPDLVDATHRLVTFAGTEGDSVDGLLVLF